MDINIIGTEEFRNHPRKVQVDKLASHILEENGKVRYGNSFSNKEIYDKYIDLCEQLSVSDSDIIPQASFQWYLSKLSQSESSAICRDMARCGYIYSKESLIVETAEATDENESKALSFCINGQNIKEKELYEPLTEWLKNKCSCAYDISNQKTNGKWGNPDILGLNYVDLLGVHLQVITIEAKRDVKEWRTEIFEAIAHTVFSHYSYYAFLCSATYKVPDLMRHYATKFGIGVIAIRLQQGSEDASANDRFYIEEIVPARENNPDIRMVKDFYDRLPDDVKKGYVSLGKK